MNSKIFEIHEEMLSDIIKIEVDLKEISFFFQVRNNTLVLIKNFRIGRNGVRQEQYNFNIIDNKNKMFKLQYIAGSTSFFTQK